MSLNPLPVHERVNPLSRTFSGPTSTASSFDELDLMPGGSVRRRSARRKAKEWTAPKMGSFPWTPKPLLHTHSYTDSSHAKVVSGARNLKVLFGFTLL